VRPSAGTFLNSPHDGMLAHQLAWSLLSGERELSEVVEVRAGLEIHAVRLVASRGGAEAALRLDSHLEEMAARADDVAAFIEADRHFHEELADSARNTVLTELLQITHTLLRTRAEHGDATGHMQLALDEHRRIRDAIASGDAAAAAAAMEEHMASSAALLVHVAEAAA